MEPVVEEAALLPAADVAQQQLDFELAVLKALPGSSSVTDFPTGGVMKCKANDLQGTNPLEVAMHLRAVFATPEWLSKHEYLKINEIVVIYIDKDEIIWPAGEPPKYTTFPHISQRYSFCMRPGAGRVGGARYCCHCPACCLAFDTGEGMNQLLDVAACQRRHLNRYEYDKGYRYGYQEATIECNLALGQGNAKARAKALWQDLKRLLKEGKFAAVQARELWSTEERVHMRPGHFWACVLGNADLFLKRVENKGSPILAGPFASRQYWPPNEGEEGWLEAYRGIARQRYDEGECALILRCYYHRTADDREGLTFVRWMGQRRGEILVINSSELRAVQGRQACDFQLTPPVLPQPVRQQQARDKKKQKQKQYDELNPPPFDPKQRWRLDRDIDSSTRQDCAGT